MVCRFCRTRQDISDKCENCDEIMGTYFCSLCNLLRLADEKIFHCDKCKICRVGDKSEYMYCDKCESCVYIKNHENEKIHKQCGKISGNCVSCKGDILKSNLAFIKLKCDHYIHNECLIKLALSLDAETNTCGETKLICPECSELMYEENYALTPVTDETIKSINKIINKINTPETTKPYITHESIFN